MLFAFFGVRFEEKWVILFEKLCFLGAFLHFFVFGLKMRFEKSRGILLIYL